MKTIPVDVPAFKDLGNPAFAIDTPRDHIRLGAVCLCVAKARSGKSRFVTNLLYQLKQAGCMHRIFCLSDTTKSNHKMLKNLDIRPEDVISPRDPNAVAKIDNLVVFSAVMKCDASSLPPVRSSHRIP